LFNRASRQKFNQNPKKILIFSKKSTPAIPFRELLAYMYMKRTLINQNVTVLLF